MKFKVLILAAMAFCTSAHALSYDAARYYDGFNLVVISSEPTDFTHRELDLVTNAERFVQNADLISAPRGILYSTEVTALKTLQAAQQAVKECSRPVQAQGEYDKLVNIAKNKLKREILDKYPDEDASNPKFQEVVNKKYAAYLFSNFAMFTREIINVCAKSKFERDIQLDPKLKQIF